MAFLEVFRAVCLVTACLFSPRFLISSFQITGIHQVQFQLPHFRDIWQPDRSRPLLSSGRAPQSTQYQGQGWKDQLRSVSKFLTVSFWLLDQNLEYSHATLPNQVSYFQRWLKFLLFENLVLTLTAPGTTAEEPWPCWEPLHAKWDLIFPKYLGEEKQCIWWAFGPYPYPLGEDRIWHSSYSDLKKNVLFWCHLSN